MGAEAGEGCLTQLAGKVIWITGASGGIGEALARSASLRGARLILTARRVTAQEGVDMGFINRVVADDVMHHALRTAETIAALSPDAVRANLQAAAGAAQLPLEVATRHVYPATAALWSSERFAQGVGVQDFLEGHSRREVRP